MDRVQAVTELSGGGCASFLHPPPGSQGGGASDEAVMATNARAWVTWITALGQGVDHAVTDEEVATRRPEHPGEYQAVCGAAFFPAAMEAASSPPCPACTRFLRARATLSSPERRLALPTRHGRHRRPDWWTRLACPARREEAR